jgi:hypothetical protein
MRNLFAGVNVIQLKIFPVTAKFADLIFEPFGTSACYPLPHVLSLLVRIFVRHI